MVAIHTEFSELLEKAWENENELHKGLIAAELNLRAMQKALMLIKPDLDWPAIYEEAKAEMMKEAQAQVDAETATEASTEAKEAPSDPNSEYPEGAAIFGG